MILLLVIITAGVFLGIMFARNTDPVSFHTAQIKVRRGIGNTILFGTLGLLALHLLGKLIPGLPI